MDARWLEVWPGHEYKSRERYGSRASSPHLFSHDRIKPACGVIFSLLSASGYSGSGGPCCQLWHAASELCCACQSDGADLSPVNLSCPGV